MVHLLQANAKEVFVAGDDDQAIFRYAGADVDYFIGLQGSVTVLDQSYRIPATHHALSQKVIQRVIDRRPKEFNPRDEDGCINWHRHSEEVNMANGDWLLLSRTTRGAKQIEEEVRRRGHLYIYNGSKSIDGKVLEAVRLWENMRNGSTLNAEQVRVVYGQMLLGSQVAYGHKTFNKGQSDQRYAMQDLLDFHGLLHTLPWDEGLGKISENDRRYIKACLRKGESLTDEPRIRISTIHSAKGAQADNVMLLTDTMRRSYSMWRKFENEHLDEARVFYVGLTRALQHLHLIHPMYSRGYQIPA
jgi:superfamily I DNA/RNA helicase